MCSAKAVKNTVNTVSRVTSGVVTLGGSEIARNNLPSNNIVNKVLNAPGQIVSGGSTIPTVAVATGLVKPDVPDAPPMPDPAAPGPDGPGTNQDPPSTITASDPTELAAQLRRRRLAQLGRGIAATIASSAAGDTSTASLLSPTASGSTPSVYAAGMKAKLGQ